MQSRSTTHSDSYEEETDDVVGTADKGATDTAEPADGDDECEAEVEADGPGLGSTP